MCCVCVGPVSLGEKPFNRPSNRSLRCRSLLQSVETLDDAMAARQLFPVQCEPPHALSKPVSVHQAEEQPARGWSYAWWHPATRNHPVVRSDANHGVSPLQQPLQRDVPEATAASASGHTAREDVAKQHLRGPVSFSICCTRSQGCF